MIDGVLRLCCMKKNEMFGAGVKAGESRSCHDFRGMISISWKISA